MKNLKKILYQPKKSIEANKSEHPTGTLATTFQKPSGEANPYVCFGYIPHTIWDHTRGQVSVSMNDNPINKNKQLNNKRHKDGNQNSK